MMRRSATGIEASNSPEPVLRSSLTPAQTMLAATRKAINEWIEY